MYTMADIIDCEFYLLQQIGFYLTVYHPYKPLLTYIEDIKLKEYQQTAWNIVNDSYFSDVCFQYPPHMIALAAIYFTCILKAPSSQQQQSSANNNSLMPPSISNGNTQLLKLPADVNKSKQQSQQQLQQASEPLDVKVRKWFDQLNVKMQPIGLIAQQLVDMYQSMKNFDQQVQPLLARLPKAKKVITGNITSPIPINSPSGSPSPQPHLAQYNSMAAATRINNANTQIVGHPSYNAVPGRK